MAIYKDGKKWVLAKDGKALFEEFKSEFPHLMKDGKFAGQLHLKYSRKFFRSNEYASDNLQSGSKRFIFPRKGVRLDFREVGENGESTRWQYCTKAPSFDRATGEYDVKDKDVDLLVVGSPTGDRDGHTFILPKDIETAWLVWKFSRAVMNRPQTSKKNGEAILYFENKIKEAESFKNNRKAAALAENKIWDMNRSQLVSLYRTVFGSDIPLYQGSEQTDAQVQQHLVQLLQDPVLQGQMITALNVAKSDLDIATVVENALINSILISEKGNTYIKQGATKILVAPISSEEDNYGGLLTDFLRGNPEMLKKVTKQVEKIVLE